MQTHKSLKPKSYPLLGSFEICPKGYRLLVRNGDAGSCCLECLVIEMQR